MDDANLSLTEEDVISIVKKISIRKTEYFATTSILLEIVKTLFFRNSNILLHTAGNIFSILRLNIHIGLWLLYRIIQKIVSITN